MAAKRPPRAVRVSILIAAVACLGLVMCARTTRRPEPTPHANPANQAPTNVDADEQGGTGTPMQLEEGKMGKKDSDRFPASKAPGSLY